METLGDWTDIAPWKHRKLLLMRYDGPGNVATAMNIGDKRQMLREAAAVDLVAVWPGEWATTARCFGPGDVEKVAERLG